MKSLTVEVDHEGAASWLQSSLLGNESSLAGISEQHPASAPWELAGNSRLEPHGRQTSCIRIRSLTREPGDLTCLLCASGCEKHRI